MEDAHRMRIRKVIVDKDGVSRTAHQPVCSCGEPVSDEPADTYDGAKRLFQNHLLGADRAVMVDG